MSETKKSLRDILTRVSALLSQENRSVYLVGGFVRDEVLARGTNDIDLAVKGDALLIAESLAKEFSARYIPLDIANNIGRITSFPQNPMVQINIVAFSYDIKESLIDLLWPECQAVL